MRYNYTMEFHEQGDGATVKIASPRGFLTFFSSLETPVGPMEIEGKTTEFTFVVHRRGEPELQYREGEPAVWIRGKKQPVRWPDRRNFPDGMILGGDTYSHHFRRFTLKNFSLHHDLLRNGMRIGDFRHPVNSRLLFFRMGGKLILRVNPELSIWEPLLFAIAWWWDGCFVDSTPS